MYTYLYMKSSNKEPNKIKKKFIIQQKKYLFLIPQAKVAHSLPAVLTKVPLFAKGMRKNSIRDSGASKNDRNSRFTTLGFASGANLPAVFCTFWYIYSRITYGPFANYLQIVCHKAKIKEETHASHRIQIFLMFFDEIQIIFMVLVHLHYVHGHEILNCTLIYSTVICHKRTLR